MMHIKPLAGCLTYHKHSKSSVIFATKYHGVLLNSYCDLRHQTLYACGDSLLVLVSALST
jgi:hypothetical protein